MFKYLYQTHYFVMLVYIVCMFVQDSDIEKKISNQQLWFWSIYSLFSGPFKRFSRDFARGKMHA